MPKLKQNGYVPLHIDLCGYRAQAQRECAIVVQKLLTAKNIKVNMESYHL